MSTSNFAASEDTAPYAGDIGVTQTFEVLRDQQASVLVDVRTEAEWGYVGVPDLSALGKHVLFVQWKLFPSGELNPAFVEQLSDALMQKGLDQSAPIFFLCRSGVRSKAAAQALTAHGFQQCFNVAHGFEGQLDAESHRGSVSGWKAEGLPWLQT
ncbi:rhodanese-like domain-containing protein [Rhodobacteraceae bacterium RKSG542]|uniref:rhodanese-like domain-containing protein n=1 Tax=Pseudovibrio flavus TaxID=2529854 RepID=UPI0012BD73E1|nr:rhodanese-like domain-containing protein [Pseudovibrio flavus]MTI18551.1 rhodanese-like domain-containing protein [Pseudovibrio flavus]